MCFNRHCYGALINFLEFKWKCLFFRMASGGYGRGGRGAALLQALSQPARKPGDNDQEGSQEVKNCHKLLDGV